MASVCVCVCVCKCAHLFNIIYKEETSISILNNKWLCISFSFNVNITVLIITIFKMNRLSINIHFFEGLKDTNLIFTDMSLKFPWLENLLKLKKQ